VLGANSFVWGGRWESNPPHQLGRWSELILCAASSWSWLTRRFACAEFGLVRSQRASTRTVVGIHIQIYAERMQRSDSRFGFTA